MDIGKISTSNTLSRIDYGKMGGEKAGNTDVQTKSTVDTPIEKKLDGKGLKSAVDVANKVLFKNNSHLQFRIHEKTKDVMVKIIDDTTGEVLKEIPPEKMLDMVAKLWEIAGILIDEKR